MASKHRAYNADIAGSNSLLRKALEAGFENPARPMMDDRGVLIASLSTIFIGFSIVVASAATKLVHPFVLALLAYTLSIISFLSSRRS